MQLLLNVIIQHCLFFCHHRAIYCCQHEGHCHQLSYFIFTRASPCRAPLLGDNKQAAYITLIEFLTALTCFMMHEIVKCSIQSVMKRLKCRFVSNLTQTSLPVTTAWFMVGGICHHCCYSQKPENMRYEHGVIARNIDFGLRYHGSLTPRFINSCLEACPSDIMALSLLLWFGRQPGYFHESQAYKIAAPVVQRLMNRLESVDALLRELEKIGCVVKAYTFLVLMRISWQESMYELAVEAFQAMSKFGFIPNTYARNMIIDILFKIGQQDAALSMLNDTYLPNYLTYEITIKNLCKLGDVDRVQRFMTVVVGNGYSPNFETYMMVVNCFCKARRVVDSLPILGLMITSGHEISVSIWSILIDGFCRIGSACRAVQMLRDMEKSGCCPNVFTYTSIIKGLFEVQMFEEAWNVWHEMQSKGCVPDLVLYNVLIHSFCKRGQHNKAVALFLQMDQRNLKPDSYTLSSLVPTLRHGGDFVLFRRAGISLDLVCYNSLMNALCKMGYTSKALEIYNDMVEEGIFPDRFSYAALLDCLCREGRVNYAINVYYGLLLSNASLDAHVHTVLLNGLVEAGRYHTAIRLFRKAVTENCGLDIVSYTVILRGLVIAGRFDEASSLFSHMVELGLVPNTFTFNVLLHGFAKTRDTAAVKKILKEMYAFGVDMDSVTFNILIGFLCRTHRMKSALHLFSEMCSYGIRPTKATYAIIIDGLCKIGWLEDAYLMIDYLGEGGFVEENTYSATNFLPLKSHTLKSILRFKEMANVEKSEVASFA